MNNLKINNHTQQILHFLQKEGFAENIYKVGLSTLSGDGSSRLFFNIKTETASFCGVLPARDNTQKGLAEAHAAFNIGSHLKKRGLPVPVPGFRLYFIRGSWQNASTRPFAEKEEEFR
ncbi:hypothetical protein ACFLZQ_06165 [Thermodesulfobacteriota bacterium]